MPTMTPIKRSLMNMGSNMPEPKTDETLLRALHEAAQRKLSPEELREQRVSFIMGTVKSDSGVTRERIRHVLAEQEGAASV